MRAVKRGLVLAFASTSLLGFTFAVLSAAESVKRKEVSRAARNKSGSKLETTLPFRFGGYRIGNPSSKNNFPGVYSAIGTAPEGNYKGKGFYTIGCSIGDETDIPVYLSWDNGPKQEELYRLNPAYSMFVIYFIENDDKQYIYGTVLNGRGLTSGIPVLTESKYWDCDLGKRP